MKTSTKYIIAGSIALISITGAFAYLQIKKLTSNIFGFRNLVINKLSLSNTDLNIFFKYLNNSDLTFTIKKQTYDIYINGKYITTASNKLDNVIRPKQESIIGVNVSFNPKEVFSNLGLNALDTKNMVLKIVMRIKIKFGFISFTVPYTYEDSLKNMMGQYNFYRYFLLFCSKF